MRAAKGQGVATGAKKTLRAPQRAAKPLGATLTHTEAVGASYDARVACLRFIAPLPVSTNNAYATVDGKRVKTKAAREFSQRVAERAVVAKAIAGGVPYPPFALHLGVWFPDEGRRDLSNTVKLLEDSLMKVIGSDDRHVHLLVVRRQGVDRFSPRVDVELREHRGCVEPLAVGPGADRVDRR